MTNEEIFEQNKNIAYKIANRYINNYSDEIEDIRQIALLELWRCIEHWDHVHALTTYTYICIPNKINMYLRHVKKHAKYDISINAEIPNTHGSLYFEDTLADDYDILEDVLTYVNLDIINNIELSDIEKQIINLKYRRLYTI